MFFAEVLMDELFDVFSALGALVFFTLRHSNDRLAVFVPVIRLKRR